MKDTHTLKHLARKAKRALGMIMPAALLTLSLSAQAAESPSYQMREQLEICPNETIEYRHNTITGPGTYYDTLKTIAGRDSVYIIVVNPGHSYLDDRDVTIRQGSSYWWRGRALTAASVYTDSLRTTAGCDSVYRITVHEKPVFYHEAQVTACETEMPYLFFGEPLYSTGTYYHTSNMSAETDTVIRLVLTVLPKYVAYQEAFLCAGGTYEFFGQSLTTQGVYEHHLLTQYGCDSLIQLALNVVYPFESRETKHITEGETYRWQGQDYRIAGDYTAAYKTQYGCDSIYYLRLVVHEKYAFEEDTTVCESDLPYLWHGKSLYRGGIYYDSLNTVYGTDSVYKLDLSLGKSYRVAQQMSICQGGEYNFYGRVLTEQGVYEHTLLTRSGCDSVIVLSLNILPPYESHQTVHITEGESYAWRGETYRITGTYTARSGAANGCDSVHYLHLQTHPVLLIEEDTTVCENELPLEWHSKLLYHDGTYYDSLKSVYGTDSVYKLTLQTRPKYRIHREAFICAGEEYEFFGHRLTTTGTYEHTLKTQYGCDSVITLSLNVVSPFEKRETRYIVAGDKCRWQGKEYTVSGTYREIYQSQYGCDSVYYLTLVVSDSYRFEEDTTVCENDLPYLWHGKSLYHDGVYYDSLATADGTDSIYQLTLHTGKSYRVNRQAAICQGEVYNFYGQELTATGVYEHTLRTYTGCDSVIVLSLNVGVPFVKREAMDIAEGEAYTWQGEIYTVSGTYMKRYQSVMGCDSVYYLTLTVHPKYLFEEEATVCENDLPYVWHNKTLSQAGVYYDSLKTWGFATDSVYKLTLHTGKSYRVNQQAAICRGEVYNFYGQELTATGVYEHTLQTYTGCDSVIVLSLNVGVPFEKREAMDIAEGEAYTWQGESYTVSGTYMKRYQSVMGCDSVYYLTLTVHPKYLFEEETAICDSEAPFQWHGKSLYQSGVYYDSLKTRGFAADSVYKLNLKVNGRSYSVETELVCESDVYTRNGREYAVPGVYYDTLVASTGCDSIVQIQLNRAPTYLIESEGTLFGSSVYYWRNKPYYYPGEYYDSLLTQNGCDSVFHLTLHRNPTVYIEDSVIICDTETPYLFHGRQLYTSGEYFDSLRLGAVADTIHRLVLTVHPSYIADRHLTICEGETLTLLGQSITAAGIYEDAQQSVHGCDSVTRYIVNRGNAYHFEEDRALTNGETINWHGQTITTGGTFTDHHESVTGCDSTYVLNVVFQPSYRFHDTATVCQEELPYEWHGMRYVASGDYELSLRTVQNRDSIYALHLTVLPTKYGQEYVSLCQSEQYTRGSKVYEHTGVYYDTLKTVTGCDSVVQITINRLPQYLYESEALLNEGSTYQWHGKTYNAAGVYYDSARTVAGCDSVYKLTLRANPAYHFREALTICERETPYEWHGQQLYTSGTYYDRHKTVLDNDSDYTIDLTVMETKRTELFVRACPGESYYFKGAVLSERGTYSDTLVGSNGCDSIVQLRFSFAPSYSFETDAVLAHGATYQWREKTYNAPGIYYDRYKTADGCDSVYKLTLHENPVYYVEEEVVLCEKEAPYIFRGRRLYESGVYYDSITSTAVSDSVYKLTLTIHKEYLIEEQHNLCDGEVFEYHGQVIDQPGIYFDSLLSVHGCDSVYKVVVNRVPSFHYSENALLRNGDSMEWHGQTISAPGTYYDRQKTVNGCDSVYELVVDAYTTYLVEEKVDVCENDLPYQWQGNDYYTAGTYAYREVSGEGYDSIYSLVLNIVPIARKTLYKELCENETYEWRGLTIDEPGIYIDTLHSTTTCDSILTLVVNKASTYIVYEYGEVCSGSQYLFRDTLLSEPGVYDDTLRTVNGCDSIIRLVLNTAPAYEQTDYIEICQDESFEFRGRLITEPGVYFDSLKSVNGCDSVFRLIVNRAATYHYYDTIRIADNETREWHGQTITAAGTYHDYQKTASGCDSIYELYVEVYRTYLYTERVEICEDQTPYEWKDNFYTHTGKYYHPYSTVAGYDSIYCLDLIVNPVRYSTTYVELCEGETFLFRGEEIAEPGEYADTLRSENGCDSIVKVVVSRAPTYRFHEEIEMGDNQTITWHGQTISAAGTYRDEHKTIGGCDSIYTLDVTVRPTYLFETELNLCKSELPYEYEGEVFTHAGTYYRKYLTAAGYDSIYSVTVNVLPTYEATEYHEICRGEVATIRGQLIEDEGIYYDSLKTTWGCDSVIRFVVNYAQSYYFETDAYMHENGIYEWRNHIYRKAGVYYDSLRAVNGCDSIYKLTLHQNPVYYFEDSVIICQSEAPYIFGLSQRSLYHSGIYYDSLKTVNGVDSVYRLSLTVRPTYLESRELHFCEGQSLLYNGQVFTHDTLFYDTLKTTVGCDSIFRIIINRVPRFFYETEGYLHKGGTYEWRGESYTKAGVYYDSLPSVNDCDSIYRLTLHENPTYHFLKDTTVCQQELPYVWRGQSLYETDTYWDSLKTVAGVDSIYELRLTVNPAYLIELKQEICNGDSYTFNGRTLTRPGIYYDSLKTALGCDSVIKLTLNYARTYLMESERTICEGETFNWFGRDLYESGTYYERYETVSNGCDSVYKLTLHVAPQFHQLTTDTICQDDAPYVWRGKEFYRSTDTTMYTRNEQGCDSVFRLRLTLLPKYLNYEQVTICDGDVYMFRGREITVPGTYDDTLRSIHGCDSIYRITVNVLYTHTEEITAEVCDGETYLWDNGHKQFNLTRPGTYYDTLPRQNSHCDSIHYVLHLTMRPTFYERLDTTVCANELPFVYHGKNFYEDTDTIEEHKTVNGCDSIYEMHLRIVPFYLMSEQVTICEGETYQFRGRDIHEAGIFDDTLRAVNGCDSIYRVIVNVAHTHVIESDAWFCKGDEYFWNSHTGKPAHRLIAEGTYYDTIRHANNRCDSIIYVLHLHASEPFYTLERDTICDSGAPYIWRGIVCDTTGTYYDSLRTQGGCDSVYELRLVRYESFLVEREFDMCSDETFIINDRVISQPGIYYDSLLSIHGCDSVVKIVVNYPRQYRIDSVAHICEGDALEWRGQTLTLPGIYTNKIGKTVNGCDSVEQLTLVVDPVYHELVQQTIFSNDTIRFHEHDYTFGFFNPSDPKALPFDTIFKETYRSQEGCDSIYELQLHVVPAYKWIEQLEECQGATVEFRGQVIVVNTNVVFEDTLKSTVYGSDSIRQVIYNVHPSYTFHETMTRCSADYIEWHGQTLHTPGLYYDRYTTVNGCDSVYIMDYKVDSTYNIVEEVTICPDSLPYAWRGREFWMDTVLTDTFLTVAGCDSLFTLDLRISNKCSEPDSLPLCGDSPVIVRGEQYTVPGQYSIPIATGEWGNRPDSVYRFIVFQARSYQVKDSIQVCQSEIPYYFNDLILYESGVYTTTFPTIYGCDSVVELHFGIRDTHYAQVKVELCPGEEFRIRDSIIITKPGIYRDTLLTIDGCDSVVQFVINEVRSFHDEYTDYVMPGQPYPFHKDGEPIYVYGPGIYFDSLRTVNGCDSVYKLILYEKRPRTTVERRDVCEQDFPFEWVGHRMDILEEGTYEDHFYTREGTDSTCILIVTKRPSYVHRQTIQLCEGDHYTWLGHNISTTGTYTDTLTTLYGCDSIEILVVNPGHTYFTTEQITLCPGQFLHLRGRDISEPGEYYDTLIAANGCDSIRHFIINMARSYLFDEYDSINPGTSYRWHQGGDPDHGGQVRWITRPGTYFDSLTTVSGCDSVYRLNLVERMGYYYRLDTTICESDQPFFWKGHRLYTTGIYTDEPSYTPVTYWDSLKASNGMDSVYELRLTIAPAPVERKVVELCAGEYYLFDTLRITQPGTYTRTVKTRMGCDSTYILVVNHAPYRFAERQIALCPGDLLHLRDRDITEPGVYYDTLLTHTGCDSVIRYVVNRAETFFFDEFARLNPSSEYRWYKHGEDGHDQYGNYRLLNGPGVYFDSLRTTNGCDSVYRLNLIENQGYYFVTDSTICEHDGPFYWEGHLDRFGSGLTETGTYWDSLKSSTGTDSIYCLHLTVHPAPMQTKYIYLCDEASFELRGKQITQMGIYLDTMLTDMGCYDITKYVINRAPKFYTRDTVYIHDGETYTWKLEAFPDGRGEHHDRIIVAPGEYEEVYESSYGCDSVIVLTVFQYVDYYHEEYAAICYDDAPYQWKPFPWKDAVQLYESGTYLDSVKYDNRPDSVYKLELTVYPRIDTTIVNVGICNGDTLYIRDRAIRFEHSGVRQDIYDTLRSTIFGCDSIIKYVVNVYQDYYIEEQHDSICDGTVFRWANHNDEYGQPREFRFPGVYWDSCRTVHGCDSIYKLTLHFFDSSDKDTIILVCPDNVPLYYVDGTPFQDVDTTVVINDTIYSPYGCRQIFRYHYVRTDHCSEPITDYICENPVEAYTNNGLVVTFNDVKDYPKGRLYDVYEYTYRIDPILVKDSALTTDPRTGEEYYEYSTHYEMDTKPRLRLDSVTRVILKPSPATIMPTEYLYFCQNNLDGQTWREHNLEDYRPYGVLNEPYTPDTIHAYDTTDTGCYSKIYSLVLTIYPANTDRAAEDHVARTVPDYADIYDETHTNIICKGTDILRNEPSDVMGKDTIIEINRRVSYPNNCLCDDIYRVHVTVVRTRYEDTYEHICVTELPMYYETDEYNSETGVTTTTVMAITAAGTYDQTVFQPGSWTSIIRKIHIDVDSVLTVTKAEVVGEICPDPSWTTRFEVAYEYNGSAPTEYSIVFDANAKKQGFQDQSGYVSSYSNTLSIEVPAGTNGSYVRPDRYSMTIMLHNACSYAATPYKLDFEVNYPSTILDQMWDNVIAVYRPEFNGGYDFASFVWWVNDQQLTGINTPYLHYPNLQPGDRVVLQASRPGDSYTLRTCEFIVEEPEEEGQYPVLNPEVVKNPFSVRSTGQAPKVHPVISVTTNRQGQYEVFDLTGTRCSQGTFGFGEQDITLPAVNGCYMIDFRSEQGEQHVEKVLVY